MSRRYWIGVASRDHVGRGVAGGFAQLCHGKAAPLARLQPGDGLIYYSPREQFGADTPCQCFTAIGIVQPRPPYQVQLAPDFTPWRRDVQFVPATAAAIRPLLPALTFITDPAHWGYSFRFGQLQISAADFGLIAQAMGATLPASMLTE